MKSKWLCEFKKIGFIRLGLLAVAVVILVVCSLPQKQPSSESRTNLTSNYQSGNSNVSTESDSALFSYEHALEKRLKSILGEMEGVTSVDVMITLSSTAEKVLEKSVQLEENKEQMQKGSGDTAEKSTSSSLTKNSEALLTGGSSGSDPYVLKEISPSVQGVVVVAGGQITKTKISEISEAVQALFGIEAHKVKVIEKKSQAEEAK